MNQEKNIARLDPSSCPTAPVRLYSPELVSIDQLEEGSKFSNTDKKIDDVRIVRVRFANGQ